MFLFCINDSSHFPVSQQEFKYHCVGIDLLCVKNPGRIFVALPYIATYRIKIFFPRLLVCVTEINNN